jgi:hypothetical protein
MADQPLGQPITTPMLQVAIVYDRRQWLNEAL